MRHSVFAILMATLAACSSVSWGAESILDTLRLGELTPRELREAYPDARMEIPKNDKEAVVHFSDRHGNKGVCRFVEDRLFHYTVTLADQTPELAAWGGWAGMVTASESTFGIPKVHTDSAVKWDLEHIAFSLSRERDGGVTVTLNDKRLEQAARERAAVINAPPTTERRFTHGGPYHLNGFQPGRTRKIELSRGQYRIELQHSGSSNFAVYMYLGRWTENRELVANEIGPSLAAHMISIGSEIEECFFFVKYANGPWTIDVRKVTSTAP